MPHNKRFQFVKVMAEISFSSFDLYSVFLESVLASWLTGGTVGVI